ncbi:hypothetical protein LXA43DRAFT_1063772 [Ganoderma leucocontextum]|nr:hypothetical protein LXA43DRAFT_1063772 [Ganoderma leucocontextum]
MLLHPPPSPTQLMGNQHSSGSEPDERSPPTDGTPPAKSLPPVPPHDTSTEPDKPSAPTEGTPPAKLPPPVPPRDTSTEPDKPSAPTEGTPPAKLPPPVPPRDTSTEPDKPSAQCFPRSCWFHFKIWTEGRMHDTLQHYSYLTLFQTGKTYIPVSVLVAHPQLRLLPGFADLPPTKTLQFWGQEDCMWVDSTPDLLPFHIHQSAGSVLVRYPSAVNCVGFPQALRLLDEERGVDPSPNEWDYDDKHPTLFYVTLTKDGRVRWDLHPQLLAHVMGSSHGDYQAVFCSWNAISHSWDFVKPSEPFKPCDRHDLAVIRHKANSSPKGLPHFLAELDAQTHRPVLRLLVAPLFTDRRLAGSEPLTMKGRTKTLWPTLVSTYARIPPRVTSLLASISSVLTSARPTTARMSASTTTARMSASTTTARMSASTTTARMSASMTMALTFASTTTTRTSASTSAVQPSRTTSLLGTPRNCNAISTTTLRRSTRIRNIQKDPPNADEGTSPPTNKGKKK